MGIEQINIVGARVLKRLERVILEELANECPHATMEDAEWISLTIAANILMNCAGADRAKAVELATGMLDASVIAIPS